MTYPDKYFKADKNHILRAAQAFVESQLLNQWVEMAIESYLILENPMGLEDDFISELKELKDYDTDFLRELYELLSAIYRLQKGNNQLEFIWDGRSHYEVYAEQWNEVFNEWIKALCLKPEVYRAILKISVLKQEVNPRFLFYGIRRTILQKFNVSLSKTKFIKSA